MKKEELTSEEIAKLSATNQKAQKLQGQMQQAKAKLQQTQKQQEKVIEDIKDRLDLAEDIQPDDLDFSQVDFDSFQGSVIIKQEDGGEPETVQPQNQGEE